MSDYPEQEQWSGDDAREFSPPPDEQDEPDEHDGRCHCALCQGIDFELEDFDDVE